MSKVRNIVHSDSWKTPESFYKKLDKVCKFDFDPCPYVKNGDVIKFNGLGSDIKWGKTNYVNPPYSLKLKQEFVYRGISETQKGNRSLFLLPVSTSTNLFHKHILPNATKIFFLYKRLRFEGYNTKGEFVSNKTGQHDSMIVLFGRFTELEILEIQDIANTHSL